MQRSLSKPTVITKLNDKVLAANKQLDALKSKDQSSTDWIYFGDTNAPPFQNAWLNLDVSEATWARACFIKDSSGWVHLMGYVGSGSGNTVLATLPQTYRPRKRMVFTVGSGATGGSALSYVTVDQTGNIIPLNTLNIHLDSISFRAEN